MGTAGSSGGGRPAPPPRPISVHSAAVVTNIGGKSENQDAYAWVPCFPFDSTTLGLLAKLSILSRQKVGMLPTLVTTHPDITRLLQSMGFDQVFNIVDRPIPCPECLTDLPSQDQNEDVVRSKVLEAHKILMGLNDSNREAFHDLVNALERS